ncbi:MAG TPA: DUF72 domain-containing protein [Verrucomicrobiae bacterium]
MSELASLRIGTSGWIYKEWAGEFYPAPLKKGAELEFYARNFNSVEVNATFYRLPLLSMTEGWHRRSPPDFLFAVKGSRFITHIKRLQPDKPALQRFFYRLRPLKEKCGPILWQLPPSLPADEGRLDRFLSRLPRQYKHAIEFRHPSWYEHPGTFSLLRKRRCAHVAVSSLRMPMNTEVTAPFTYIRFHGLKDGPRHDYRAAELKPWARFAQDCLHQGIAVFAYFNNDLNIRAPKNAKTFERLVKSRRK